MGSKTPPVFFNKYMSMIFFPTVQYQMLPCCLQSWLLRETTVKCKVIYDLFYSEGKLC